MIDSSYEGILWLEVAAKNLQKTIIMRMAVCYLPPGCSSRHVNAAEFLAEKRYEKRYLEAQGALRCKLKTYYVTQRKKLSKYVQRAKRIHWHKMQDELVSLNDRNKPEFWKKIGRMGARNQKSA